MNVSTDFAYRADDVFDLHLDELALLVMDREHQPANCEASLAFVDDAEITRLNEEYRGKKGPTDVLSFECDGLDDGFEKTPCGHDKPYELGDVVIAVDIAERQTELYETTFAHEMELLTVHGMLHLCGYDHIEESDAVRMETREQELLEEWRSLR